MTLYASMSNEFKDFENKLMSCMGSGICDDNKRHTIASAGFGKYEKVMNFLLNQNPVSNISPTYSMYKANLYTGIASHHVNIEGDIKESYYTTVQASDGVLFFNCLSIESLMMFLMDNTNSSSYVFIPVVYGSEVNEVGHFAMLTFNVITKEVFFVDPNGKASFFDNIFYVLSGKATHGSEPWVSQYIYSDEMMIDCEMMIENMLGLYVNDLNSTFGLTYKFIKRSVWNPYSHTINRNYDDTLIKSGHCVCTGTLIADYMSKTNSHPKDVFECLQKLSTKEIVELINSYSMGMYSLLIYTQ